MITSAEIVRTKTQRQFVWDMAPPIGGPTAIPRPKTPKIAARYLPRSRTEVKSETIMFPRTPTPAPPKPWTTRPASRRVSIFAFKFLVDYSWNSREHSVDIPISMAIEFAPPAMPLPSMNITTAKRVGQRRPKTNANCPKKGIKTVL